MSEISRAVRRVGIVGCGAVVQHFYTEVIPRVAGVEVVAACDSDRASAEIVARRLGADVVGLAEALRLCDWILVATPPESHYDIAASSIAAGVNVVVEKPFVPSSDEARSLIVRARSKDVQIHVAQFRRFFPAVELARKLVASGTIGDIRNVELYEGGRFTWETHTGYIGQGRSGGVVPDTGSHTIDQALFVAGLDAAPLEVLSAEVVRDRLPPSDDVSGTVELMCGVQPVAMRFRLSRLEPLANVIRLLGTRGALEVDCGLQGMVRLLPPAEVIRMLPDRPMGSYSDAFLAEYREIFDLGPEARTVADRVVNQIKVLEAIHHA